MHAANGRSSSCRRSSTEPDGTKPAVQDRRLPPWTAEAYLCARPAARIHIGPAGRLPRRASRGGGASEENPWFGPTPSISPSSGSPASGRSQKPMTGAGLRTQAVGRRARVSARMSEASALASSAISPCRKSRSGLRRATGLARRTAGGALLKPEISLSEARRIALTAQGFNALRRHDRIAAAQLRRAIDRLGLLQIDSVNVLVRAHYLPLFSRLGAYDRTLLDVVMAARPKRFFEYWGMRPRCCRSTASRCCDGAWPARFAARASGSRSSPSPAKSGRKRMPCSIAFAPKGRWPPPTWRAAEPPKACGCGAMPSTRSNGCSGRASSPRRTAGAASSASTTCPSGSCHVRSSISARQARGRPTGASRPLG